MSNKCNHCIDGCVHYITREVPGTRHEEHGMIWFDPGHRIHTCELHPEKYSDWMEKHGQVPRNMLTEKEYECFNDCYEANDFTKSLDDMINLASEILNTVKR